jgi:CzcA family heavy metal efflux pump
MLLPWLVSTSLRLRVLVLAVAAALMVLGVRAAQTAAHDVFPEFALPKVEIQTEGPGLSTEEVETFISMPVENALNGTPRLKQLRSKSVLGLSSVELFFEEGSDLSRARQLVAERLSGVRLPAVVEKPPVILQPLSSTSRAMKIGVWSKEPGRLSQMDLTEIALWTIRPRLMSVRGVANVAIWGQRDRQFQVQVDPDRLRAHGVSLEAVERSAAEAAAQRPGGFVDTPNQRLAIRHLSAVRTPEDLARSVVPPGPLRLGDVADVRVGHPPPIGDAIVGDRNTLGPGLLLIVEKHVDGNTLDVSRGVEAAMEALRPGLAEVAFDTTIFRPATFIERALANLGSAMLLGCALVAMVLVAFLFDWRTAAISMTAIPLSLLGAALVIHLLGGTVNTMILAGLVIATGEVVDDAIIDVENIARRLRLNRAAGSPKSSFQVVLEASLEVRSAVVYASLIVVLVFVPVFFLEGLAGTFFRPLAFAYILAMLASLLVALTVTPALCMMLLPAAAERRKDAPLVAWLKRGYRSVLPRVVARPGSVGVFLLAVLGATGAGLTQFRQSLLPNFQETDFLMHWVEIPGTSIEANRRITELAGRELQKVPHVRNFGSHIGRAEVADEVVGPNFTELWISIDEDAPYKETISRIQEVVDGYPGLQRDLLTYLRERIKEVLSGTSGSIVVRVFGADLVRLREKAQEVLAVMEAMKGEGVTEAKVEAQRLVPQVQVRLRPEAAERFGLTPGRVREAAVTLVRGKKVGELYEDQKIVDVAVWGVPRVRTDLAALRALPIETPSGALVPLGEVAEVAIVPAPNEIKREGGSRKIDIACNVKEGYDLGRAAREIERRVKALPFDTGYHPEFLGEYRERQAAQRRLLLLGGAALAGILVLLQSDFQSFRSALIVFLTLLFFAPIGGVAGALLAGGEISLGSLVGFVTVLGIAARNGIMLVSHYRHLEEEEGMKFGPELVLRGAEERLSPILMTALSAALALLPLAVRGNVPGHEIEYPMAVVILGGLVTSTLLNLFLVPSLYARYGR